MVLAVSIPRGNSTTSVSICLPCVRATLTISLRPLPSCKPFYDNWPDKIPPRKLFYDNWPDKIPLRKPLFRFRFFRPRHCDRRRRYKDYFRYRRKDRDFKDRDRDDRRCGNNDSKLYDREDYRQRDCGDRYKQRDSVDRTY